VTIGILLAVAAAFLIYILLFKTRLGYQIRMTGLNPSFARYSGMNAMSCFCSCISSPDFSGASALGGAFEHLFALQLGGPAGLGFNGALMAMMGKNNPIGVLVVAFGISYLQIGAEIMSRSTTVPVEVISIVPRRWCCSSRRSISCAAGARKNC
jgi:simple sugar transport system permease protein